jgi:hypothetical protein
VREGFVACTTAAAREARRLRGCGIRRRVSGLLLAMATLCPLRFAVAQEPKAGGAPEEHHAPKRQKFAFYQGTSWIPKARNPSTGEKQTLLAPAYGLVYEYWFTHRVGLGTYDDIDLVNTQVESDDGDLVKRENTVSLTGALVFVPGKHWTVSAGPGVEFEHHETVWLVRLGAEYGFELPKDWELSVGASYKFKDFYDSWGLGLTIGRRFGSRLPLLHSPEGQPTGH